VTGVIDGQGGVNALNYSAYAGGVYANLRTSAATGTAGIHNIQNATGSSVGGDILVGNGAGNVLSGTATATRGSIIIGGGGSGSATLTAGGGGDILIAGSTAYDQNVAALNALLATWDNAGLKYSQRVAALQAGVTYGNGQTAALTAATVTHGTASSTLTGSTTALDWFFARLAGTAADVLKSLNKPTTETVTTI
jgi:hypothetical protein